MLSLHAEQERRGEVLVCEDAGSEGAIIYSLLILLIVVTVGEGNDPPDNFSLILFLHIFLAHKSLPENCKDEPGEHEASDEG